jgi:uncharacterized protein YndB with AHSA1/START domain
MPATPSEDENRIEIRRVIPASREEVFAAWTDPKGIRVWMCPGGVIETEARLDVRVGGDFKIVMKSPGKDHVHTGTYQVVDPPSRLAFTWISEATDFSPSLVTVELFDRAGQTELVLTHERMPRADVLPRYKAGWATIAEKLGKYLTKKP